MLDFEIAIVDKLVLQNYHRNKIDNKTHKKILEK